MKKYDDDFLGLVKTKQFSDRDIAIRLSNFKVIRNFPGTGHSRFEKITKYLKKHGYKEGSEVCGIKEVNNLIQFIIKELSMVRTSAASKLLWPFYPKQVVIYDKLALNSLRRLGGIGLKDNYEFYHTFWHEQFKLHQKEIIHELKKNKKPSDIVTQKKIFDLYLWKLGR